MADEKATKLIEEFHQLKHRRNNWEDVWTEIQENVIPRRTGFETATPQRGKRHDSKIYDGSPLGALILMAQGFQGYQLSPSYRWARIKSVFEPLMIMRDVRLWLAKVGDILFSLLSRSNFYREMHEYIMDAGSFGTATLFISEDIKNARVWFQTRHPREIYIAEDENEVVNVIFRHTEMTYKQMLEAFDEDILHKDIQSGYDQNPYDTTMLLHVVKPNERYNPDKTDSKSMKFESTYIDIVNEMIIRESGFNENPYAVWRFYKNSDEEYGRSPAWDALGDIKAIHQYSKTNTTTAQLLANPPLEIPDDRRGLVIYKPGAHNYYEDPERGVKLMQTASASAYHVGFDRENQVREAIERAFYVPFFLMMANAEKQMTATEIMRRDEEKAVILGPMITGLNHDTLNPMFDRLFDIAWRAGWLPPPPEILLRAGGKLEIDYMGPLAQAQRRHFYSEPYRGGMVDLSGVVQLDQMILDNFNWDYVAKEIVRANNWPEEAINSERVVAEIRRLRRQAQEDAKQQAMLETMGKAAPGLNEPVKEESLLKNIGKQAVEATR